MKVFFLSLYANFCGSRLGLKVLVIINFISSLVTMHIVKSSTLF